MKLQQLLSLLLPLLATRSAQAGDVRTVGDAGTFDFQELQPAVDASSHGDVLLVAPGAYSAFTIDDKALSVIAAPGASVVIQGTIEVRDLAASRVVVLVGLSASGAPQHPRSTPGLLLVANAGHVRAQGCTFVGGEGVFDGSQHCFDPGAGGAGVEATSSLRVALEGCTLRGGVGGSETNFGFYECVGGVGGDGVRALSSAFALYDCDVRGGDGGDNGTFGGKGGAGHRAEGFGFFASGSTLRGGDGGEAWDFIAAYPGDGGDGAVVLGTTAARLDTALVGGAAGTAIIPPAVPPQPGQASSGDGTIALLPGVSRTFRASAVAGDLAQLAVHVEGQPGDRAYLARSIAADFAFAPTLSGVWLAGRRRYLEALPLGVVPANGVLDVLVKTADLAPGLALERQLLQGIVLDAGGTPFLASPMHVAVLDHDALPDCDANGSLDVLDVFEGTVPDCNANLIPDACDISSGWSGDVNDNGIPDECEG